MWSLTWIWKDILEERSFVILIDLPFDQSFLLSLSCYKENYHWVKTNGPRCLGTNVRVLQSTVSITMQLHGTSCFYTVPINDFCFPPGKVVKKTFLSVQLHCQSHCHHLRPTWDSTWDFQCCHWSPFAAGGSGELIGAPLDSLEALTHCQTKFPYWFHHRFPIAESQISGSFK